MGHEELLPLADISGSSGYDGGPSDEESWHQISSSKMTWREWNDSNRKGQSNTWSYSPLSHPGKKLLLKHSLKVMFAFFNSM